MATIYECYINFPFSKYYFELRCIATNYIEAKNIFYNLLIENYNTISKLDVNELYDDDYDCVDNIIDISTIEKFKIFIATKLEDINNITNVENKTFEIKNKYD